MERADYKGFGYLSSGCRKWNNDKIVVSELNKANVPEDEAFIFLNSMFIQQYLV
jgi:hypothetical protein